MQVGELTVRIGLDLSKLTSDLAGVEAKLKGLGGSLADLAKVKGFSDVTASSKQLKDALGAALPVAQQLKARLQEQQTQYGILGAKLAEVTSKYGATSKQAQTLELAMQKLGNGITQTTGALNNIDGAANKAANAEKRVGDEAATASKNVKSFGEYVKDALSTAGGMILAQGIQAIGSAIAGSVTVAADFEHALSGVAAVAGGLTNDQMEGLRQKALQVGADTSLSASEAVAAMENLVANGIDPTQAGFSGVVDATVALAEATGSDLSTAANVATDVIQNFAGAGDDLNAVINGITGVTVAGKFGIDDYRLALSNGGVAAAGYGVTLSDFNTAIAATSSAFASGQTAGTSFRTFVERLTPSTETAKKAMMELGLITADGTNQFYTATGAIKSQTEIFGLLESKFGGLSDKQKAVYAEMIFGAEAANFVTAAVRVGADGFEEYGASIEKISAAEQAKTRLDNFAGAVDTLKGSLETVSIVIVGPLLNALTPLIQTIAEGVGVFGMFANSILSAENPLQALLSAIDSVIPGFQDLANQAIAWGANIVTQFSNGIVSQFGPLIAVLQQIGSVIRSWLMPGSPPKIVPDLDTWGADAATVYFEGWAQGDYSALQEIGGTIQSTLKGMIEAGKSSMGEEGIIPALIGSQSAIANAINQLHETGSVGEDAIQGIVSAAGDAGPQIEGLVRTYFDLEAASQAVAEAQQELNDVTQEYADKLDPLNAQLDAINDQQRAIKDAEKLAKLQKVLTDSKSTDAQKADAQLEIEKMGIEAQIRATENEKAVAVDAAKEKLDAAKETEDQAKSAYDAQKAQLAVYNQQNSLIKEQTALLQRLADAAKPKGGAGGGGGGLKMPDIGGGMPALPEMPANPLGPLAEDAQNVKQSFLDMKDGIAESMGQISTSVAPVISFVQNLATQTQAFLAPIGAVLQEKIVPPLMAMGNVINTTILPVITRFKDQFVAAFSGQGPQLLQQLQGYFVTLAPIIGGIALAIGGGLYGAFVMITGALGGALPSALSTISSLFQGLQGIIQIVEGVFIAFAGSLIGLVTGDYTTAGVMFQQAWETVKTGVGNLFSGLVGTILGLAGTLLGGLGGIMDNLLGVTTGTFGDLATRVTATMLKLKDDIIAFVKGAYDGVVNWFKQMYDKIVGHSIIPDLVNEVLALVAQMRDDFIGFAQGMYDGVIQWFNDLKKEAVTAVTDLATEIGNTAETFLTSAKDIGTSLVTGIVDGVKKAAQKLYDAVANVVESAMGSGEDAADAHSPSRETRDRLGIPLVQGIIVGIQKELPHLLNASADMTEDFIQSGIDKLNDLKDQYVSVVRTMFTDSLNAAKTYNSAMIDAIAGFVELSPQGIDTKQLEDDAIALQEKLAEIRKKYASDETNPAVIKERDDALAAVQAEITANDEKQKKATQYAKELTNIQAYAQQEINRAQQEYLKNREQDPIGAAKIFEAKKQQILELAKLDKEEFEASMSGDKLKKEQIQDQRKYYIDNSELQLQLIADQVAAEREARAAQIAGLQGTASELQKIFADAGIGKNIVGGIAEGIKNQASAISAALTEAMKQAVTDLRAYLGIHSPSKMFAQDVAMPSMQGWVNGVYAGQDALNRAFVDTGSLSLQSATMALGSSQSAGLMPSGVSSGDTYNITLDLRGSSLSQREVETVLDKKLQEIASTAKRLKKG